MLNSSPKLKFRKDINGLRAFAVMAVLLFHFFGTYLPGGFSGVDIFFVISGYLMTVIILNNSEKIAFSILKFYIARAVRILPALLVLILSLFIFGWFFLMIPEYQELGKQSVFTLTFLSNIYYWRTGDYFHSIAETKWLLHTWSLAVEAQFYFLYPIFLLFIQRYWKNLTPAFILLILISLSLNLIVVNTSHTEAFFILPTRAWEFSVGGLIYLIAKQNLFSKKTQLYFYWLGWIFIIFSFSIINQNFLWPSYWTIFSVLGTGMIILSHQEQSKLLNNYLIQWIGTRSYSLYLWHWPLVAGLYFFNQQNQILWIGGAIVTSLFLAHISYHLVENPSHQYASKITLYKKIIIISVVSIMMISLAFTIQHSVLNKPLTIADTINPTDSTDKQKIDQCFLLHDNTWFDENVCTQKNMRIKILLIGDSHAAALYPGLKEFLNEHGIGVDFYAAAYCLPVVEHFPKNNSLTATNRCEQINQFVTNKIKTEKYDLIVLSSYMLQWSNNKDSTWSYNQYYQDFFSALNQLPKNKLLIIGNFPIWKPSLSNLVSKEIIFNHYNHTQDISSYSRDGLDHKLFSFDQKFKADSEQNEIKYFSILSMVCKNNECLRLVPSTSGPKLTSIDYGHLSLEGSKYYGNEIVGPYILDLLTTHKDDSIPSGVH